jgi:drug/metabolite transporter (DMT)-like permease
MNVQTDTAAKPSVAPPQAGSRNSATSSFLILVLVNAMWAFQFSGAKVVTESLGPIATALLPLALSTLLFAPFVRLGRNRTHNTFSPSLLLRLLMIGTLGVVPAQWGLTWGVQHSLASNASVITLTIPVLTAMMAAVLLNEKMTGLRWLSFALAIIGVLMVSQADLRSADIFHGTYLFGNLLILASCLGSAFNNTYSKKLLEVLNPVELLVFSFLVSDIDLLVLMMLFERSSLRRMFSLPTGAWTSLLGIAVFSLSISMMLYFWVIQRIDVTQASLSIYLLPVFGVLFSAVLLHEKVTFPLVAGGALVFAATFLVTVYEERQKGRLRDATEGTATTGH